MKPGLMLIILPRARWFLFGLAVGIALQALIDWSFPELLPGAYLVFIAATTYPIERANFLCDKEKS